MKPASVSRDLGVDHILWLIPEGVSWSLAEAQDFRHWESDLENGNGHSSNILYHRNFISPLL